MSAPQSPSAGASPAAATAMYQQQQPQASSTTTTTAAAAAPTSTAPGPRAHLYIGNLSPRVTEYMLSEIFSVAGTVVSVKIIPDRHFQHGGINYGFVEYADMRSAETALATLNGRRIFETEIRVNWAHQTQQQQQQQGQGSQGQPSSQQSNSQQQQQQPSQPLQSGSSSSMSREEQGQFHVFVGDLSAEVNDEVLAKAFGAFGTLTEARVMWDMNSGKSRGYGFLAFKDKADAEQAISSMNGEWLGSRAIRVNWANQKTQTGGSNRPGASGSTPAGPLDYTTVVAQTPAFNTTVYVGNLIPYSTQADLIPLFQGFGYIVEVRMQADRGFAFVKLDSHENAALAICALQDRQVHGRPIKCSWGKDRESSSQASTAQGGGGVAGGVAMGMQQPGGVVGAGTGMMGHHHLPMQQPGMMAAYPGMGMYGMPPPQQSAVATMGAFGGYPAYAPYGMGATSPSAAWPQDPAASAYYQQHPGGWGSYYGGQAGSAASAGAAGGQQ